MKKEISFPLSSGQRNAETLWLTCQKNLLTESKTGVPIIAPYQVGELPDVLLNFKEAMSKKCTNYIAMVHFYIYDFQFIPLYRNPEKYIDILRRFSYVLTPDMSQYREMPPFARYHYNCMNKAMGAYLQANGVNIIANVSWSLPDSYEYAFVGIPKHSTIAINSNGVNSDPVAKNLWFRGYEKAVETLQPERIIRYGTKMSNEYEEISVYFENPIIRRMRYGC